MQQQIQLSSRIFLLAAVALILSDDVFAQSYVDERVDRMQAESLRVRCGPRAAWAFSQHCGIPLDHDATMASFVLQDNSVSLGDIAAFLNAQGVRCEMRCLSPTELAEKNRPAIVYLLPASQMDKYGHFVVIVATDERGVTVIEPQVGRREKWTWQFFSDRWTGHCIMQAPGHSFDRLTLSICILINVIAMLCVFFRR